MKILKINSKYLTAKEGSPVNGKKIWVLKNKKTNGTVGCVVFDLLHKQYCFVPLHEGKIFTANCLENIAKFLRKTNKELS